MDTNDVTNLMRGVTMDGTTFDFGALCSSVSKTVIIHLIAEYVKEKVQEEYPPEKQSDPEIFKMTFEKHKDEITEAVWAKYSEMYTATRTALRKSIVGD